MGDIVAVLAVLPILALYFGVPVRAFRRAQRYGDKDWSWAIRISFFLLLGWLVGSIYLLTVDRRRRETERLWEQRRAATD